MQASGEAPAHNCTRVPLGDPLYPDAVRRCLGKRAPAIITARGSLEILARQKFAVFCSASCPGNLILQTYDLIRQLRDAGVTVIGGFHSPMEKECLTLLMRGGQPVVVCLARGLDDMRLPAEWRDGLARARLLILSPFAANRRRITTELAAARNAFVAALADEVFVAHAAPGSRTEQLCHEITTWEKPLLTLESAANAHLFALGTKTVRADDANLAGARVR